MSRKPLTSISCSPGSCASLTRTVGEDLAVETFIPMGNGQRQVIGSGATGAATAGWCDELTLFNSSLQNYWVEIRYGAGHVGF
jgi:hypothetical protein